MGFFTAKNRWFAKAKVSEGRTAGLRFPRGCVDSKQSEKTIAEKGIFS
jgi:hypothetical protein